MFKNLSQLNDLRSRPFRETLLAYLGVFFVLFFIFGVQKNVHLTCLRARCSASRCDKEVNKNVYNISSRNYFANFLWTLNLGEILGLRLQGFRFAALEFSKRFFFSDCVALDCIALHCVALRCIVLYCIVSYRIVSYCIVLYIYSTVQHTTFISILIHITIYKDVSFQDVYLGSCEEASEHRSLLLFLCHPRRYLDCSLSSLFLQLRSIKKEYIPH